MSDFSKKGVASRLAQMVEELGITQEELGLAADRSKQAAHGWLRTGRISNDCLKKIADHFGYSFTWLLSGDGTKRDDHEPISVPGGQTSLTSDEYAMLMKYRRLSEDEKRAMQTIIDAMDQPDTMKKTG